MPVQNYKYEKRQKDLEKKKKRDEKLKNRLNKKNAQPVRTPTPPAEVRQLLEKVHGEIENARNVDEKGQELLSGTRTDIRALLDRPVSDSLVPHPSMTERMEETIDHLEATHPELTGLLSELLNILSNVGI